LARHRDPESGEDRALRGATQFVRPQDRALAARARERREVLRSQQEGDLPARKGRRRLRQRSGDAATAAQLEIRCVPERAREYKKELAQQFNRTLLSAGHCTSLPLPTNSVSLDPDVKDAWGVPALRITYQDHPQDLKVGKYFAARGEELLQVAGALKTWQQPVESQEFGFHLLGTCRMGDDPKASVVDKYHRAHDVKNLFIVDGSSFVTGGRGQPTMTIQAL